MLKVEALWHILIMDTGFACFVALSVIIIGLAACSNERQDDRPTKGPTARQADQSPEVALELKQSCAAALASSGYRRINTTDRETIKAATSPGAKKFNAILSSPNPCVGLRGVHMGECVVAFRLGDTSFRAREEVCISSSDTQDY